MFVHKEHFGGGWLTCGLWQPLRVFLALECLCSGHVSRAVLPKIAQPQFRTAEHLYAVDAAQWVSVCSQRAWRGGMRKCPFANKNSHRVNAATSREARQEESPMSLQRLYCVDEWLLCFCCQPSFDAVAIRCPQQQPMLCGLVLLRQYCRRTVSMYIVQFVMSTNSAVLAFYFILLAPFRAIALSGVVATQ